MTYQGQVVLGYAMHDAEPGEEVQISIGRPLSAVRVQPDDVPTDTTILAFDPGGHTGWCRARITPDGLILPDSNAWDQIGPRKHHRDVRGLLATHLEMFPHLVVVAENYVPEFGRPQNYVALEYLGVIEEFCQTNMVSLERQSRGEKDWWTRERLQAIDMWPVGKVHAQDAARHWAAYAGKYSPAFHRRVMRLVRDV